MKSYLRTHLVIAAALSAFASLPVLAGSQNEPMAYPVSSIALANGRYVSPGDSRAKVIGEMGRPDRRVSPDVWIYRGYTAGNLPDANPHGCNAMVVTFSGGWVRDIKFVNPAATTVIAANSARNIPTRYRAVVRAAE